MWRSAREFLVRHKKIILIAILIYVAAIAALILLSQGPQTEPFLYQIN